MYSIKLYFVVKYLHMITGKYFSMMKTLYV